MEGPKARFTTRAQMVYAVPAGHLIIGKKGGLGKKQAVRGWREVGKGRRGRPEASGTGGGTGGLAGGGVMALVPVLVLLPILFFWSSMVNLYLALRHRRGCPECR